MALLVKNKKDEKGILKMKPQVSIVTLGVSDIDRSRSFYEKLGWKASSNAVVRSCLRDVRDETGITIVVGSIAEDGTFREEGAL